MIRSPTASLSFKGQATKHTTVNWSVINTCFFFGGGGLNNCNSLSKSWSNKISGEYQSNLIKWNNWNGIINYRMPFPELYGNDLLRQCTITISSMLQVVRVESTSELLSYIESNQLTPSFGGSLPYDHTAWIRLQKVIPPLMKVQLLHNH